MSVKINKNDKEYPIGVIPQSLYDDVEDLKDMFKEVTTPYVSTLQSGTCEMFKITDVIPTGYVPISAYAMADDTTGFVLSIGNPVAKINGADWWLCMFNPYATYLNYHFVIHIICKKA